MLREILITLIIAGLAGLIAPTSPRLVAGRIGIWLQRLSAALIVVTIVSAVTISIYRPGAIFSVTP